MQIQITFDIDVGQFCLALYTALMNECGVDGTVNVSAKDKATNKG